MILIKRLYLFVYDYYGGARSSMGTIKYPNIQKQQQNCLIRKKTKTKIV